MEDKLECIKTINTCLEKLLENLIEILELLKVIKGKGTKVDEMTAQVFAKKRMAEFTEAMQRIFQNLVYLKLIHKNSNNTEKKEKESRIFKEFFQEMTKGYEIE